MDYDATFPEASPLPGTIGQRATLFDSLLINSVISFTDSVLHIASMPEVNATWSLAQSDTTLIWIDEKYWTGDWFGLHTTSFLTSWTVELKDSNLFLRYPEGQNSILVGIELERIKKN